MLLTPPTSYSLWKYLYHYPPTMKPVSSQWYSHQSSFKASCKLPYLHQPILKPWRDGACWTQQPSAHCKNDGDCIPRGSHPSRIIGACISRPPDHCKGNRVCIFPHPSGCVNQGVCTPRASSHRESNNICIPRGSHRCRNNDVCTPRCSHHYANHGICVTPGSHNASTVVLASLEFPQCSNHRANNDISIPGNSNHCRNTIIASFVATRILRKAWR